MLKFTNTGRGFACCEFKDADGQSCRLQKSSAAERDCVWLGVTDPKPSVLAQHAQRFGLKTDKTEGWIDYPIPEDVLIHTEMFLTKEQVAELLPVLQRFVETGEIDEVNNDTTNTNHRSSLKCIFLDRLRRWAWRKGSWGCDIEWLPREGCKCSRCEAARRSAKQQRYRDYFG